MQTSNKDDNSISNFLKTYLHLNKIAYDIEKKFSIYISICLSVPQNTVLGKFMYYFTEHRSMGNQHFHSQMWFSYKQRSMRERSFFLQKVK